MIALCAVIACPAEEIKEDYGGVHVGYVDDRTRAATTAELCWEIGEAWKKWSTLMGLKERKPRQGTIRPPNPGGMRGAAPAGNRTNEGEVRPQGPRSNTCASKR